MESRKHDYKNRTLAAARLRKELKDTQDALEVLKKAIGILEK